MGLLAPWGPGRYLVALALTLALEVPVYACLLRVVVGVSVRRGVVEGTGVNLVSHPLVILVVLPMLLRPLGYAATLATVEVLAVAVEWVLLWGRGRNQGWSLGGISYVANGLSFAVGLLVLR